MEYEVRHPSVTECEIDFTLPEGEIRAGTGKDAAGQLAEAAERMLNAILEKEGLRPLSTPLLHPGEEGKGAFRCRFEVLPPVSLPEDLCSLELRLPCQADPAALQKTVDALLRQNAQLIPVSVSRPPRPGEVVVVDVNGFYEGRPVPGMQGRNQRLTMAEGPELPAVLRAVAGLLPGQSADFALRCPDNYPDPLLRGKQIEGQVVLQGIFREEKPEFDDGLARRLGFPGLPQLKQAVYEFALGKEMERLQEDARRDLLARVVEHLDITPPRCLVLRAFKRRLGEAREFLSIPGEEREEAAASLLRMRDDMVAAATEEARVETFLLALARHEGIQVAPAELEAEIRSLAEEWQESPDEVRKELEANGGINTVEEMILARKAMALMARKATVTRC